MTNSFEYQNIKEKLGLSYQQEQMYWSVNILFLQLLFKKLEVTYNIQRLFLFLFFSMKI